MKIFLLIHERDTDTACDSNVRPFTGKLAAQEAMRKSWKETASDWEYASKEHDDEDECECREDAAVIREGGNVEHWRIEEQELPVPASVAVEVSGGLVHGVYAKGGDVEVFDLDESEARGEALRELVGSPGWKQAWRR